MYLESFYGTPYPLHWLQGRGSCSTEDRAWRFPEITGGTISDFLISLGEQVGKGMQKKKKDDDACVCSPVRRY